MIQKTIKFDDVMPLLRACNKQDHNIKATVMKELGITIGVTFISKMIDPEYIFTFDNEEDLLAFLLRYVG